MKQVAILGTGASWVDAPFDNPEIEIWGLNYLNKFFGENPKQNRFDRWFHLHPRELLEPYIDFLRELPIPLVTLQHWDDIPNSVAYPKIEIEAHFGAKLWRCSASYMIALAIYEKYDKIYLFGINMGSDFAEYSEQKPTFEYWIGRAHESGIEVIIPESSDILKVPFDYGYETCPVEAKVFEAKMKEIAKTKEKLLATRAKHEQQIGAINAQLFKLDGMLEISEYYKKLIY